MRMTATKKQHIEENVVLLHEDIMMLILSKLPRKSLLRFKCVSKEWFHLIHEVCKQYYPKKASPCQLVIVCRHQQQQRPNISRFSVIHLSKVEDKKTSLLPLHDVFDLKLPFLLRRSLSSKKILSSNGLVCFFFQEDVRNYAFNPTTRHILRLPHLLGHICNVSLIAGFGYLPQRDEYKIVEWFVRDDLNSISPTSSPSSSSDAALGCWILSLKKNINGTITVMESSSLSSWRGIGANLPPAAASLSDSFCVNGTIYWLCHYSAPLLLSFDLDEEAFQLKPRPSFPITAKMVEIEGCLCVGAFSDRYWFGDDPIFTLWKFRNGDCWEVKHKVRRFLPFDPPHHLRFDDGISLLAYTRSKKGARELVFMADEGEHGKRLIYYNLKSRLFRTPSENLKPLMGDDGLYFLF